MKYDFDRELDRTGTASVKWDFIKEKTGDAGVIPLWVADMDFAVADEIRDAILARASHPVYGYTVRGDSYYDSLIAWYEKRQGWKIGREWITHSNGVLNAVSTAIHAMTKEGDGVIIQPPVYHPFPRVIKQAGRRVVENPLVLEDGVYRMDYAGLERTIQSEKPGAMLLCNPHNPVGRVFTRGELARLGEICLAHGIPVISDEIHGDIIHTGRQHIPFVEASPGSSGSSIVCTAPSKTFNLAGLSTSNIIIPDPSVRAKFEAVNRRAGAETYNLFGAVAAEAAYAHGGQWFDETLAYIGENKRFALAFLEEHLPRVRVIEPEGTYFLWFDLSFLGLDDAALETFLVSKARIWVNQGYTFGHGGSGVVRKNLACRRALLEEALGRLKAAVLAR